MLRHLRSDLEAVGIKVPDSFVTSDNVRSAIEVSYPASTPLAFHKLAGDLEPAGEAIRNGDAAGAVAAISAAGSARAARQHAIEVARELKRYLDVQEDRTVRESAEILLDQCRPIAAKAVEKLRKAVETIGPDVDNRRDGPDAWKAGKDFTDATEDLNRVRSVVAALHACRYLPVGSADAALWFTDPETIVAARRLGEEIGYSKSFASWLDAGYLPKLNTLAETVAGLAAEVEWSAAQPLVVA